MAADDLVVDGVFGWKTQQRLQEWLTYQAHYRRTRDGVFGYYSCLALQHWLHDPTGYGAPSYYPSGSYWFDGHAGQSTWEGFSRLARDKGVGIVGSVKVTNPPNPGVNCTGQLQAYLNKVWSGEFRLKIIAGW